MRYKSHAMLDKESARNVQCNMELNHGFNESFPCWQFVTISIPFQLIPSQRSHLVDSIAPAAEDFYSPSLFSTNTVQLVRLCC